MRDYFGRVKQSAMVIWAILAIGIVVSSAIYAVLRGVSTSETTSLFITFLILVGLIIPSLLIFPVPLLKLREENRFSNPGGKSDSGDATKPTTAGNYSSVQSPPPDVQGHTTPKRLMRKNTTSWTGFSGKTLWNWLDLFAKLAIPLVVVLATIGFGLWQVHLADIQHQSDQMIANQQHMFDQQASLDQQRAAILQTYIDNIQDLLLNHNLLKSKQTDDVAILARARTLTALHGLNPERKGRLLIFLHEAQLIGFQDNTSKAHKAHDAIIDLRGADLIGAKLGDTNLFGADLSGTNLFGAELYRADLR